MFNQDEISAAWVMIGRGDQGSEKRGAVVVFEHFVASFFVDEENWKDDPQRRLVPLVVNGVMLQALPINNIPVDPLQVSLPFDDGSLKFFVPKIDDPRTNNRGGQLVADYKRHGTAVREYVSVDILPAETIQNIVTRMILLTPGNYQAAYKKMRGTMGQVGQEYNRLFS